MRRGTILVLSGVFAASLNLSYAISDDRNVIRNLPDRPDLRRECTDRKCKVFHLLPTWRKPETDLRQDTKAQKKPVFRLLSTRDA